MQKRSRLKEKGNDARGSQPHLQRKRDQYDKTAQDLLLKKEALKKRWQENDGRKQEIDKKEQVIEETKQKMDKIRQEIEWMHKEIEKEFPYLGQLEVEENAEHPMSQVEQPTSAASPICLLGQAFPSTQLENKECRVPRASQGEAEWECKLSRLFRQSCPLQYPSGN